MDDAPAYVTYVKKRLQSSHNQIREWLLRYCSWKMSEALACQLFNKTYKNAQLWQWVRILAWAYAMDKELVDKLYVKCPQLLHMNNQNEYMMHQHLQTVA